MKTMYAAGLLVILAVAAVAVVGFEAMTPGHSTVSGSSTSSVLSGATSTGSTVSQSGSATSSQSTSQGASTTGDFAMMATDPPVVASGVTAATASYDSLAVHSAGQSNATGWTDIQGTGTINLMSSANVSQTIAAAKIASGTYDMVRMGIQSASVTYQGKVYAAAVASENITSKLQSSAQVTSSQSTAAVVDLRTFIINAANSSQPQFVFSACAKSTTVPPSATTSASLQVGAQTNLQGSWWVGFQDQTSTNIAVTSATLTSGSLSLQLKNSGNSSANIQTVVITPVSAAGTLTATTLPGSFSGSAVLSVGSSGQVQASNSLQVEALLGGSGTQCGAGSSTTLSYSGSISLGLGVGGLQLNGVISGQQYLVTIMGANTYGSVVVTAQ
jgi:trimeric autotransporter adhesin